jgi:hypothetical protein
MRKGSLLPSLLAFLPAGTSRAKIGKPFFDIVPVGVSAVFWQMATDTPGNLGTKCLHQSPGSITLAVLP